MHRWGNWGLMLFGDEIRVFLVNLRLLAGWWGMMGTMVGFVALFRLSSGIVGIFGMAGLTLRRDSIVRILVKFRRNVLVREE